MAHVTFKNQTVFSKSINPNTYFYECHNVTEFDPI